MRPCRVLITGGEGFIGANLAQRLSADGHEVHIISRPNPDRAWKLLDLLGVEARVHAVDLRDRESVLAACVAIRPEEVYHLAGRVDLERSSTVARLCIEENILTTVNVLDALQSTPVERVVYTSTTEVYGNGPIPFREDQPLDPPSPYSVSKVAGESFCGLWARTFQTPVRVVRMAAAFGPGQRLKRLVPSVILAGLHRQPLALRSPHHRRDYLYVSDAVDGIIRAARASLAPGAIVNLGTLEAITIGDLARSILAELGADDVPLTLGEGRPNEASCWTTDATRAARELGWRPLVPIAEGLRRTIAWYRALVDQGRIA